MGRLTGAEIAKLDPYVFMGVIGKRVIHPGGREATERLLERAAIREGERVLDIGCGVATTAITIARRYGASVTAADISPIMLERARANVRAAGVEDKVTVQEADILSLPYADGEFDCVIAEAVTMFVKRRAAAAELVRVCRPGGRVLATEFMWRKPPTEEAREIFLGEVCPGLRFDTVEDWIRLYSEAGIEAVEVDSGPFEMMTPRGFVADEGFAGSMRVMGNVISRPAKMKKMLWLMPRMMRAVPYLGYIVVAGRKPDTSAREQTAGTAESRA
jgi:ubiquinone/menaquinone biosynthesis C-methylase UbiE